MLQIFKVFTEYIYNELYIHDTFINRCFRIDMNSTSSMFFWDKSRQIFNTNKVTNIAYAMHLVRICARV